MEKFTFNPTCIHPVGITASGSPEIRDEKGHAWMTAAFVSGLVCHPHCWRHILADLGVKAYLRAVSHLTGELSIWCLSAVCSGLSTTSSSFLPWSQHPQPFVKLSNDFISLFYSNPTAPAPLSASPTGFSASPLSLYIFSSKSKPPCYALLLGRAEGRIR